MGWMPTTATMNPFNTPTATPQTSAIAIATSTPYPRYRGTTALARAMTAPTERSMPSVAMTSAMPSATMITGTAWISWRRSVSSDAKLLVNSRLNTSRAPTAT